MVATDFQTYDDENRTCDRDHLKLTKQWKLTYASLIVFCLV